MKPNLVQFETYQKQSELDQVDLQGWIDQTQDHMQIDIKTTPCDVRLLLDFDLLTCCKLGVVPWRKLGTAIVFLCHYETSKSQCLSEFPEHADEIVFADASLSNIENELRRMGGDALLTNAHETCPSENSVRSLKMNAGRKVSTIFAVIIAAAMFFAPLASFIAITFFVSIFVLGNSVLRLLALIHISKNEPYPHVPDSPDAYVPINGWPSITVLIPLYRESEVLDVLITNLMAIDYPKNKLDIKLLIEDDDQMTSNALTKIKLPTHFDIVRVTPDSLRTKPKAMNFALPFCRSDIIGIYDAEDKPDITQLRQVAHKFAGAPKDTACVQCELDFFNTRQNWFTRCFTIEYRIWFASVLPIVQKLGMAVPLGGTSVFIKREILQKIGAWDAHNVTEDADLGIRLKRNGYETLVLRSRTMEEANPRGISWIRQRSRWLKGYMMTWLCHMRAPRALLRDLGWVGFVGFHIMFMGAIVNYLSLPFFWVMSLSMFEIGPIDIASFPLAFSSLFFAVMLFSQVVNISLAYMALRKNENTKGLFWWYLTMPLYWPLGAIAAYKATIEVIFAPYYWDKTQHGQTKITPSLEQAAD